MSKEKCSYGMVGGCFTDFVLQSSRNYRQERATEPRQLREEVAAVGGPERAIFARNFQAIKVVICGIYVF